MDLQTDLTDLLPDRDVQLDMFLSEYQTTDN